MCLNADSDFDTRAFHQQCAARGIKANIARNPRATNCQTDDDNFFNSELYRRRTLVEHTNDWLDSFKILLGRDETRVENWGAFH